MPRLRWSLVAVLVLAVASGAGAVAANTRGHTALLDEESEAGSRAAFLVNSVLFPVLSAKGVARPMTYGQVWRPTELAVRSRILTDPRMLRVRIWRPDGTIVYSSDPEIGRLDPAMAPVLRRALAGKTTSSVTTAHFVGAPGAKPPPAQRAYETLMPLRVPDRISPVSVAQVDQSYAAITDAAAHVWHPLQVWLEAAAAILGLVFVLALRRLGLTKPEPRVQVVGASPGLPPVPGGEPQPAGAGARVTPERSVAPRLREMAGEPDVILLGVRMPELYGIELARRTARTNPHATVVMVSSYDADSYRVRSLPDGDEVLIPKSADADELVGSMRVMAGFHDQVGFDFRFSLGEGEEGEEPTPPDEAAEGEEPPR